MTHTPEIKKTCGKLAGPVSSCLQRVLIRLGPAWQTSPFPIQSHPGNSRAESVRHPSRQGLGCLGAHPDGSGTGSRTGSQEKRGNKDLLLCVGVGAPMMLQPLCLFFELQEPRNLESLDPLFWPAVSLTLGLVRWSLVTRTLGEEACGVCPFSLVPCGCSTGLFLLLCVALTLRSLGSSLLRDGGNAAKEGLFSFSSLLGPEVPE